MRPNEKFSGKGHRRHICKQCSRLPKEEIWRREVLEEIGGFLSQSNISKKNLDRLTELAASENEQVAELARIVLEIGKVRPGKRKRLAFLARNHRELLDKLEETGLIYACNGR
jgi:hypothetical protein